MKSTEIIENEVLKEMSIISELDPGTEKQKAAVDTMAKLTDKMVELKKIELEEKKMDLDREEKLKLQAIEFDKMRKDQRDQKVKNGIAIAGVAAPLLVAIWANVYNWYKETEGIMSSSGGKRAIDFLTRFGKK